MKQPSKTLPVLLTLISLLLLIGGLTACQPQSQSETDREPATDAVADTSTNADAGDATIDTTTPKLNLNEASREDFLTVPNVGDRMVREFFEYRPYISIQQFRREIGKYVDDDQVAEYEQFVFVPIKVDESDEATLQQISGVDEVIAAELAGARPYGSNEAFLEALSGHISADQLAVAETYLAN